MRDVLIEKFKLQPHPEGGFFRETFRGADAVSREESPEERRSASTSIYYMLCDGAHSAWHRIRSDEVWHFYAGEPINIHVIDATGHLHAHRLGNALVHADAVFQAVVPAGHWFAAELRDPESFALVGCTVAPGFEFSEFELADIDVLVKANPQHADLIRRLGPASNF
nr:cupin domain-containing protein [Burkholderia sp. Leaf177]